MKYDGIRKNGFKSLKTNLWAVQRTSTGVDVGQEGAILIKNLQHKSLKQGLINIVLT